MDISKNAKFAFVIAEHPKNEYGEVDKRKWQEFLASAKPNEKKGKGTLTIHENVWQIPLDTELPFLSHLCEWAIPMKIPLRILFLNEPPEWIQYPAGAA